MVRYGKGNRIEGRVVVIRQNGMGHKTEVKGAKAEGPEIPLDRGGDLKKY